MLSSSFEKILQSALENATRGGHEYLTLEHLLLSLTYETQVAKVLEACRVNVRLLRQDLEAFLEGHASPRPVEGAPIATTGFQRVIQRAVVHVQSSSHQEVESMDVLIALYDEAESQAVLFLERYGLTKVKLLRYAVHGQTIDPETEAFFNMLQHIYSERQKHRVGTTTSPSASGESASGSRANTAETERQDDTAFLMEHGINLNEQVLQNNLRFIGRERELERMMQVLLRRQKHNPLLIGESGVGKTALVQALAGKLARREVPDFLKGMIIYSLDLGSVIAGARYRGDFEERLKMILEAVARQKNIILFVDEIHMLMGAGALNGGPLDASNILKPYLADGQVRCIGAITYKEHRQYIEKDPTFLRRFQKISLEASTASETLAILKGVKSTYEAFHNLRMEAEVLEAAVYLSERFLTDRVLPDKALDVLDEAGAAYRLKMDNVRSKRRGRLTREHIEEAISRMCRVPVHKISLDDQSLLKNMDVTLKRVIFGQDQAIDHVVDAIQTARAGLRDATKPTGSFLFAGPTGVGKTELAIQLAEHLGVKLVRFDMSEYMEKHSVARLIGTPPGYVGFEQGGLLTDAIDQNPHAVLLLDEIEKAHPDLLTLLLQVMDHGKLTDHHGKEVNCRNLILIMTTNAGASELSRAPVGFAKHDRQGEDLDVLNRLFSPEFRNRLDHIISFAPLSREVIGWIVDKFIRQLGTCLEFKNITLHLTEAARTWLSTHGYDAAFGARPMHRLITQHIKRPVSQEILFGALQEGGSVLVDVTLEGASLTTTCVPLIKSSETQLLVLPDRGSTLQDAYKIPAHQS